jgi:hypothetical protein
MDVQAKFPRGSSILDEMQEFAGFPKGTQRYIRRSLDVGLGRRDALRRWARTRDEAGSIRDQAIVYKRVDALRELIDHCDELVPMEEVMAPLITTSAFDLAQGRLTGFNAYRFLYERLIGAAVRPWLPAAFCSAAALPHLHPEARRKLLRTMDEAVATASGWSAREPSFMPEWVEKVDVQLA